MPLIFIGNTNETIFYACCMLMIGGIKIYAGVFEGFIA
ncbi:hypothetical protein SPWS13_4222 [Shewanella putrefaciens]|nr:hypothetical protein SPWS13_4222 [Shewanella putrefaciens]